MRCPNCGNHVEGKPIRDFKRKVTRGAIKKGSSAATGAAIGSIIPGVGTLIGAGLGVLAGALMEDDLNDFSDATEDALYGDADLQFSCPKCGREWTCTSDDAANAERLATLKDEFESDCRSGVKYGIMFSLVSAVIVIGCGYYCIAKDFITVSIQDISWFWWIKEVLANNWLWLLLCIVGVAALIFAIFCIIRSCSEIKEAQKLKKMTISEFRYYYKI